MKEEQNWYFTFGQSSLFRNKYMKVYGTLEEARERMFETFEAYWAFQYDEKEFLPQIEAYGLEELK